jgi:type IV secretion system protein VirB9
LRPIAASDDGVQTRLTFAPKRELPALFVRNDDDTESLLNFSVEGDDVVIHRVAARFVLRRGKLTGCIVNKGFAGSGERLKSGTISPTLKRDVKDGAP